VSDTTPKTDAAPVKTLEQLLEGLTPKQRDYLHALPDHNWQTWKTARKQELSSHTLYKWLREPEFAEARDLLLKYSMQAVGATYERTFIELARIGLSDVRNIFDEKDRLLNPSEWDDETAAAVQSMEVETRYEGHGDDREAYTVTKVKLHPKMDALKTLAMLHGKLIEKHEHTGKDGGPIQTEELSDFEKARRMAFLLARGMQLQPPDAPDSPPEASGNPPKTTL
jgi:phage terminase small subunit